MSDPCEENDCGNRGMCYELCAKKIVFENLFLEFGGFNLSKSYGSSDMGSFHQKYNLIQLNSRTLRWVEPTLSHELEHGLLYNLCRGLGCTEEQAGFACTFVLKPSWGDDKIVYEATLRCGKCNKLLTQEEKECGFTLDNGKTWICEDCQELYNLGFDDLSDPKDLEEKLK